MAGSTAASFAARHPGNVLPGRREGALTTLQNEAVGHGQWKISLRVRHSLCPPNERSVGLCSDAATQLPRWENFITWIDEQFSLSTKRLVVDKFIAYDTLPKRGPLAILNIVDLELSEANWANVISIAASSGPGTICVKFGTCGISLPASSSQHNKARQTLNKPDTETKDATVEGVCIICCDSIADTVLVPCGHLVLCTV